MNSVSEHEQNKINDIHNKDYQKLLTNNKLEKSEPNQNTTIKKMKSAAVTKQEKEENDILQEDIPDMIEDMGQRSSDLHRLSDESHLYSTIKSDSILNEDNENIKQFPESNEPSRPTSKVVQDAGDSLDQQVYDLNETAEQEGPQIEVVKEDNPFQNTEFMHKITERDESEEQSENYRGTSFAKI